MAKKILLAEDSVTMQQVVQMTFAAEDVVLTTVSTAEEALSSAKELTPDVVLADLSLAGRNGYDLCAEIKREGERIAVILLHGENAKFDAARARQVRADGDLVKPFDTQSLIELVEGVLSAEPKIAVQGPIESLSAPIESVEEMPVDPALRQQPVAPPLAAAPPLAPAPPPRPARPAAAAPPLRPAAVPPPVGMPPAPAPPPPAGMPPAAAAFVSNRPITIEAQPPPRSRPEPLQPFTGGAPAQAAGALEPNLEGVRPVTTQLGLGPDQSPDLPPPPPGMPLPGTGEHAAAAVPSGGAAAAGPGVAAAASAAGVDPAVYEAVSKLTKDVVERIVWEVVPDLAEIIIKEQLDRLVEKRAK